MIFDELAEQQPGILCLPPRGHLWADMLTPDGEVYGGWCTWCGTAAYDPDRHDGSEPFRSLAG